MRDIELTHNNGFVKVEESDYNRLSKYRWHLSTSGYAQRFPKEGGTIFMHREILGMKGRTNYVDHVNLDKLDNRRSNLRAATMGQNMANTRKKTGLSSKYKGVSFSVLNKNWRARIKKQGKEIWIGAFHTQEEAARAYNKSARALFGEFALLNQVT